MSNATKLQRFGVAHILIVMAAAAYFMANVEMPPWTGYVSGVNVVLFAIPAFWATRRWLGWRDAVLLWATLGILAITLETFAIVTGFPYGHFGYSDLLGYRLFGYAPGTVFLAWTPLVIGAWAIASQLAVRSLQWAIRIPLTAIFLVGFDLVLDPGAVKLGFWKYDIGGEFYGVPISNFLGWLVSGSIGALLIEMFVAWRKPLLPTPIQLSASSFFIVFFWTAIAVFSAMVVPAVIGLAGTVSIAAIYFRFRYPFDDMVVLVDENNVPIATARKLPTHDADTPLHRAFSVFIFSEEGELLLQQRAGSKKTWPLVWSNSCCGHVMLHETTADAARRRVKFELGLTGIRLKCILPDFRYRAEKDGVVENEICPVFVGFTTREPRPNADEVEATQWLPWATFVIESSRAENVLSPWATQEAMLLSRDAEFNRLLDEQTLRS